MPKKIIDNRMIEMTESEWTMYNEICKSYDKPPSMRGSDLFQGLFESDQDGFITFIKPPSTRQTSLECYLFIVSIFNHQQARLFKKQVDDLCFNIKAQAEKMFNEIKVEAQKTIDNMSVVKKPTNT